MTTLSKTSKQWKQHSFGTFSKSWSTPINLKSLSFKELKKKPNQFLKIFLCNLKFIR